MHKVLQPNNSVKNNIMKIAMVTHGGNKYNKILLTKKKNIYIFKKNR